MRPTVIAIVPAAGRGKRLGQKEKKPFVLLNGRPLISYALKTLDACDVIDGIIIAAEKSCVKKLKLLVKKFHFKKIIGIVIGGRTRYESVKNCLKNVSAIFDIVLIHDGARPFVEKAMIEKSVGLAKKHGGCIVAVPESDTVKIVDRNLFIRKTLERNKIFRAQTPQVFQRDLIEKAYKQGDSDICLSADREFTDDASLVEILGKKVKILKGSYRNIKITTEEDLKLAEVLS